MEEKPIHVITGPTASGKTELALRLAREDRNIEIVNADAFLLYRGFNIGTSKPGTDIRAEIPHHLIDNLNPEESFSAADYSRLARETIREILSRGKTPIIVGGTGFYIDALFAGLIPINATPEVISQAKQRVESEIASEGFDAMHEKLRHIDPVLFNQIQRERNPIRLHRAWEHYYATGESLGESRKKKPDPFEYQPIYTVLDLSRPELWSRIESRTDAMFEAGWLQEVKGLIAAGVTPEMPAMKAIGYRELYDVVNGNAILAETRDRIIFRTRQYAKRQSTWMRRYSTA